MKQGSFYNTTKETGKQLELYNLKAENQEDEVMIFLFKNKGQYFSRAEINKKLFNETMPTQSLSRALRNLTKKDKLIKSLTAHLIGDFGRRVYGWKYNENYK